LVAFSSVGQALGGGVVRVAHLLGAVGDGQQAPEPAGVDF